MKTLIVYGTTYGHAQDCAHELKALLPGDVDVIDAQSAAVIALTPYDQVIVGGSVYMGKVQKSVRHFCIQNQDLLLEKTLGLFLCCGLPEDFARNTEAAFSEPLRKSALSIECFGGRMDVSKMSFIHRTVAQLMAKDEKGKPAVVQAFPEHIHRMAEVIKRDRRSNPS